jgi:Right handed beta helix region/Immunoglobulin I-set domain
MRRRPVSSIAAIAGLVVAPVAAAGLASAATATTIFVATTGADGTACGPSASPCQTVTWAVTQALASGADDMTVQIAAGTYREKVAVGTVPAGRALHLVGAGAASTTIDAQQTGTVASVVAGTLTVDQLTLTGGSSTNFGGGLINGSGANLTVTDSIVTGNRSVNFGGGIASYGVLRLVRSTVSNNISTTTSGGGVSSQAGSVTITDSTVSGNSATFGGGIDSRTPTTVTGSTISGNTVTNSTNGAGLRVGGATLTLVNSTLSGNVGSSAVVVSGGTSTISGSTLSGDTPAALLVFIAPGSLTVSSSVLSNTGAACSGVVSDGGANVTSDTSCGWGTGNGSKASSVAAIGLQPLAANGSSGARTMAIDAESSAHRVVPAASCAATDQRGEPRPGGGAAAPACDAGAFELQYEPLESIYVSPSGDDAGGCGAQASPCRTVQRGVDEARFASTDDVVVHIAAGTYTETVDTGVWPAGRSLTLEGAGASSTTVDANASGSVVRVAGGIVRIEKLTLTGGAGSTYGGGIDSDGTVTVVDSTITGNSSLGGGGGIYADQGSVTLLRSTVSDNMSVDGGGAVAVDFSASLFVTASTLSGNTSTLGGAIYTGGPQTDVATSTLADNGGYGTVFVKAGQGVALTDSTISAQSGEPLLVAFDGSSTVRLSRSVVSDDGSLSCVGASFVDGGHNVTSDDSCGFDDSQGSKVSNADAIGLRPLAANGSDGPQTMAISGGSSAHLVVPATECAATDQRGEVRPGGGTDAAYCDAGAFELQLNSLSAVYVATGGSDTPSCGASDDPCQTVQHGVEQARLSTSDQITVHVAAGTYAETVDIGTWPAGRILTVDGAGASATTIDAEGSGTVLSLRNGAVVVSDLTLTGGNQFGGGGGLRTNGDLRLDRVEVVGNTSDAGGGAFVAGTLTITDSTLADNTGDQAGGGALFVSGGTVTIATSTITGNDGPGAAIFNAGGTVTLSASTLADNGPDNGRGALVTIGGTTSIESSVLSDSGCESPVTDGGFNVTSDDSCGFDEANHNVVGTVHDIGLAPLGEFGGPTRTMPPRSFSLAAFPTDNRVPAGSAGCPASTGTDQRGVARPKDGGCDVGAVELAPTTLRAVLVDGKLTASATAATSVPADLPALAGAVTFAQANRTLSGCEQVPVDASGHMSCTPDSLVGTLYSTFESANGYAYSRDTVSGIATIVLSPGAASVALGQGRTYTVTGYDDDGAAVGDVTSSSQLAISPDGSCTDAVCTPAAAGRHTVSAGLDGLADEATLDATAAPVVSAQPRDQEVDGGDDATFQASATGYPTPAVQWQRSTDGTRWTDIDGATSTTLTLADVTEDLEGTSYRAVFTSSAGVATSDAATLSVRAAGSGGSGPAAALPRTGPLEDPLLLAFVGLLALGAGAVVLTARHSRGRPG